MKQIDKSNVAVKKEFTELDKKREDFEEQIKNEVSQKSSIINVKEEIASIIKRFKNIEESRRLMDPKNIELISNIVMNWKYSGLSDKIISYFPQNKQNFKVKSLYRGSRDGWSADKF